VPGGFAPRKGRIHTVFSGIGCRESGSRTPVDQISPVRHVTGAKGARWLTAFVAAAVIRSALGVMRQGSRRKKSL
jgi:hypothetical protein